MKFIGSIINTIIFTSGSLLGLIFRKGLIRKARNGKARSEKRLMKIIRKNRKTEYGKKYGFSDIHSIDDYRNKVPFSTYEDYEEYVDQMRLQGRQNLITSTKITKFATTSGTTGNTKYIPQVSSTYVTFFKCCCIFVNQCIDAFKRRNVSSFNAKGFLVTEVTDSYKERNDNESSAFFTQHAAGSVKSFVPLFTQIPKEAIECGEIEDKEYIKCRYALQDRTLKFIVSPFSSLLSFSIGYIEKNFELLIEDIEKGTIDPNIKMSESIRNKLQAKLKPDPERAAELRKIMTTPSDIPFISRLWRDMSFITAIGSADFEAYTKTVRELCLDDVTFNYSIYAASESIIGVAINPDDPRYLLLETCFFEFIPVDSDKPDETLLLNELEEGKLYEVVLTSKAGFYRYRIKDVVRVVGYEGETPMIVFAYRTNTVTNINGIHITGEHLSSSIKDLEDEYDLHVADYSIYENTDYKNIHFEVFVEFEKDIDKRDIKKMESSLDLYLQQNASDYAYRRKIGQINHLELHIVKKDTYFNYRNALLVNGAFSNQLKALRLIDTEEKKNYLMDNLI